MIFTSKRPSENTVSDGLQHFIQLRKMVRQRRVIVQRLQRGGNAVRTACFQGNCAGDGIGQSLRVGAIEEKARFGFHHFASTTRVPHNTDSMPTKPKGSYSEAMMV